MDEFRSAEYGLLNSVACSEQQPASERAGFFVPATGAPNAAAGDFPAAANPGRESGTVAPVRRCFCRAADSLFAACRIGRTATSQSRFALPSFLCGNELTLWRSVFSGRFLFFIVFVTKILVFTDDFFNIAYTGNVDYRHICFRLTQSLGCPASEMPRSVFLSLT